MESLETDMQLVVRETAKEVIGMWNSTKDAGKSLDWLEAANFDPEAKIACWALLPSDLRSAIKRYQESKKPKTQVTKTPMQELQDMDSDIP